MKSRIALILCIVMCFSALVSCKGADDSSSNISSEILSSSVAESETESLESSAKSSEESSEPETTPAIPENAAYFTGKYYNPLMDGMIYSNRGLIETHSSNCGSSLTDFMEQQGEATKHDDKYYYIGMRLNNEDITDPEEKKEYNGKQLKQAGFIPGDDPYLNMDYVRNLYTSVENETKEKREEVFRAYTQSLMPEVDLSLYSIPWEYKFEQMVDFSCDCVGYITIDGLKELKKHYTGIQFVWLPAPDDRARFLTYIYASKVGQ